MVIHQLLPGMILPPKLHGFFSAPTRFEVMADIAQTRHRNKPHTEATGISPKCQ